MASPFSETMESRRVDLFKMWRIGLIAAIALCALWASWFFSASFATVETSRVVRVTGQMTTAQQLEQRGGAYFMRETKKHLVVAEFPVDTARRIAAGQRARVHVDSELGELAGAIPATVVRVAVVSAKRPDRGADRQIARVFVEAEIPMDGADPFTAGAGGVVHVQIERHTPADVVFGASGLDRQTPPVSSR